MNGLKLLCSRFFISLLIFVHMICSFVLESWNYSVNQLLIVWAQLLFFRIILFHMTCESWRIHRVKSSSIIIIVFIRFISLANDNEYSMHKTLEMWLIEWFLNRWKRDCVRAKGKRQRERERGTVSRYIMNKFRAYKIVIVMLSYYSRNLHIDFFFLLRFVFLPIGSWIIKQK